MGQNGVLVHGETLVGSAAGGLRLSWGEEGDDLALTTDFRSVVGEVLTKHIGVADLKPVFPGFDNNPRKFPGLIKT